ncbi:hypothetical protein Ae201684P_010986 [Aphanomyces euteiches]|uniref:Uncharacterized protein n=1 Tax=Aphanomyces euteiches TaxID=100861 RepID=A0A6G0XYY4_9STRA|nr:hypothetical protein Ae201684_000186 [Aphanomyces euteiches]KAH9091441.1 hypothetical protein Ae201684P_010986 [Aphanomyces euteiches]
MEIMSDVPMSHADDNNNDDSVQLSESLLVDLASEPLSEPADGVQEQLKKQSLTDRLVTALREVEEQRRLLEAAASNGTLLAEKYFALEQERDALRTQYMETKEALEELEAQMKHNNRAATSVQKCIDLEQQLNTHMREQGVLDETRARQEAELMSWRTKALEAAKENARLRELVATLEKERETAALSRQHVTSINRKVQSERDELLLHVKDMTTRLDEYAVRDHRLTLSNDVKQQKIQRLEALVEELQDDLARANVELVGSVETAKQHENTAKELRGVINGLKRSLSSLQEDYQLVVEKHNLAVPEKSDDTTKVPVEKTGWEHFLVVVKSIKDFVAHLADKCTGGFFPLGH